MNFSSFVIFKFGSKPQNLWMFFVYLHRGPNKMGRNTHALTLIIHFADNRMTCSFPFGLAWLDIIDNFWRMNNSQYYRAKRSAHFYKRVTIVLEKHIGNFFISNGQNKSPNQGGTYKSVHTADEVATKKKCFIYFALMTLITSVLCIFLSVSSMDLLHQLQWIFVQNKHTNKRLL